MKKVLVTAATGAAIALSMSATAFAWTYGLTGKGACQTDGSYLITWSVDNTTENEALHITASSNTAVVPLGDVSAKTVKPYQQIADGTTASSYTLSLSGNWTGDKSIRVRSATVKLDTTCQQPGGKGGGTTTITPVTPAPVTTTTTAVQGDATVAAPIVVPTGAINAGEGGASTTVNIAAAIGLVASAVAAATGIIRRLQNN